MQDEWFGLLSDDLRRTILFELLERHGEDKTIAVAELPMEEYDPRTAQTLLYHIHLPRLDSAGVISWDRDEEMVAHGPQFEDLKPLLEATAPLLDLPTESDE